jgi:hypothetical protein
VHSRHFIIFAGALCIAAMLSYLFVFADAPIVDTVPPPAADTAPPPAADTAPPPAAAPTAPAPQ